MALLVSGTHICNHAQHFVNGRVHATKLENHLDLENSLLHGNVAAARDEDDAMDGILECGDPVGLVADSQHGVCQLTAFESDISTIVRDANLPNAQSLTCLMQ